MHVVQVRARDASGGRAAYVRPVERLTPARNADTDICELEVRVKSRNTYLGLRQTHSVLIYRTIVLSVLRIW